MILIYDGQCEFCIAWLAWLKQKLEITSHSFHEIDPASYGITREACEQSVQLVTSERTYSSSDAIAQLLKLRGNRFAASFIKYSGPFARFGYRWVASHRNSFLIKQCTKFLNLYCE